MIVECIFLNLSRHDICFLEGFFCVGQNPRRCLSKAAIFDVVYRLMEYDELKKYHHFFSRIQCGFKGKRSNQKEHELNIWKDALAGLRAGQCAFSINVLRCRSPPGLYFIFVF